MTTETRYSFDDTTFSDLYKDAYGFRPARHEYYAASPDRKQQIWDNTIAALDRTIEQEWNNQLRAVQEVERTLAAMIGCGARDRDMAIRWLAEAHGVDLNPDMLPPVHPMAELEYLLDLPFHYFETTPAGTTRRRPASAWFTTTPKGD